MCIQSNLNYQLHSLLAIWMINSILCIMTHIKSYRWLLEYELLSVSCGQFGVYSTIMILGPNQYYLFIDNIMLECIPFVVYLSY